MRVLYDEKDIEFFISNEIKKLTEKDLNDSVRSTYQNHNPNELYSLEVQEAYSVLAREQLKNAKLHPQINIPIKNNVKGVLQKRLPSTDISLVLREYYISRVIVNKFREYTPCFMYTYGAYASDDNSSISIYYEPLENKTTVYDMLNTPNLNKQESRLLLEQFIDIFSQLLLALDVAQQTSDFTHWDLECKNVYVKNIYKEYKTDLRDNTFTIKSQYIPVIANFDFSVAKTDTIFLGAPKTSIVMYEDEGEDFYSSVTQPIFFPGVDIYRFLVSSVKAAEPNPIVKYGIMDLFKFYGPYDCYDILKANANINTAIEQFCVKVQYSKTGTVTPSLFLDWLLQNYRLQIYVEPRQTLKRIHSNSQDVYKYVKTIFNKTKNQNLSKCVSNINSNSLIANNYLILSLLKLNTKHVNYDDEINHIKEMIAKKNMQKYDFDILGDASKWPVFSQEEILECFPITDYTILSGMPNTRKMIAKVKPILDKYSVYLKTYIYLLVLINETNMRMIPEYSRWFDEFIMSESYHSFLKNKLMFERMLKWTKTIIYNYSYRLDKTKNKIRKLA